MIKKLKSLRGYDWIDDKQLQVWNGPKGLGFVVNHNRVTRFRLSEEGGEELIHYNKSSVDKTLRSAISWRILQYASGQKKPTPLNEGLIGDVDDKTEEYLKRVRKHLKGRV
jgi:hypothetical protein